MVGMWLSIADLACK